MAVESTGSTIFFQKHMVKISKVSHFGLQRSSRPLLQECSVCRVRVAGKISLRASMTHQSCYGPEKKVEKSIPKIYHVENNEKNINGGWGGRRGGEGEGEERREREEGGEEGEEREEGEEVVQGVQEQEVEKEEGGGEKRKRERNLTNYLQSLKSVLNISSVILFLRSSPNM